MFREVDRPAVHRPGPILQPLTLAVLETATTGKAIEITEQPLSALRGRLNCLRLTARRHGYVLHCRKVRAGVVICWCESFNRRA